MNLPASIELNGHKIIEGDSTSIAVTFNNLSGKNFQNPRPWQIQTHAQYLAYMANELHVNEWRGELVRRENEKTVERFQFGAIGKAQDENAGEAA